MGRTSKKLLLASCLALIGILTVGLVTTGANIAEPVTAKSEPQRGLEAPYLANGVRTGEVSPTSAVIWCRLTENGKPNPEYLPIPGWTKEQIRYIPVSAWPWESPGVHGWARVSWGTSSSPPFTTSWLKAEPTNDFCVQFTLDNLEPGTKYYYRVQTAGPTLQPRRWGKPQSFCTAPAPDQVVDVLFTCRTGQRFDRREDKADGLFIYPAMQALQPNFYVGLGDEIYYDGGDFIAKTRDEARYKWHRIYSLPWSQDFFAEVPQYVIKSDHDTWINDCSEHGQGRPGWEASVPPTFADTFSWDDGLRIWREQHPMSPLPYRSIRWGTHLQIWLTEYREFRDDNCKPDGPDKTLWGAEQLEWLKQSLAASDADFLVLFNDGPMISTWYAKNDNHAEGFQYERDAFMDWAVEQGLSDRLYLICGDKHYQMMYVNPRWKVAEFCGGAATDAHATNDAKWQRIIDYSGPDQGVFIRRAGGFLSVAATTEGSEPALIFRFHDVHGEVEFEFNSATDRAEFGLE